MKTISRTIADFHKTSIELGVDGDTSTSLLAIDVSEWDAEFEGATYAVAYKRQGETVPYLLECSHSEGALSVQITATEVDKPGKNAQIQVIMTAGSAVRRTPVTTVTVLPNIGDAGATPPAPGVTWLETMASLKAEAIAGYGPEYAIAEGARDDLYAAKETERDGLYTTQEAVRDGLYETAEGARDDLYSAAEAARDTLLHTVNGQMTDLAEDYAAAVGAVTADSEVVLARDGRATLGVRVDELQSAALIKTDNLLDTNNGIADTSIVNWGVGTTTISQTYSAAGYTTFPAIPVEVGSVYVARKSDGTQVSMGGVVGLYDSGGVLRYIYNGPASVTIPENITHMRYSRTGTIVVQVKKSTAKIAYEPFGYVSNVYTKSEANALLASIPYTGVQSKYPNLYAAVRGWSGTTLAAVDVTDESFSYLSVSGSNKGAWTDVFTPNGAKLLYITFHIEIPSGETVNLYALQSEYVFRGVKAITQTGDYVVSIDPAYYDVYYEYSSFAIGLVSSGAANGAVSVTQFRVFQSNAYGNSIFGDSLEEIIENVDGKISSIETGLISSAARPLTAPNGTRYVMQVNDAGTIQVAPVIPDAALFVGNSLLLGFGTHGMASSTVDTDYYHYITSTILEKNASFTSERIGGTDFEACTTSAAQDTWITNTLTPELSTGLNLVVVQLGDNVNTDAKLAVFEAGVIKLLQAIRTTCPNARVVWVGEWYSTAAKQSYIANGCAKTGCEFVDISDLYTTENQSAIGNTYVDSNGVTQTITTSGVASHPGDVGMLAIANRLCYKLGITNSESEITE